MKDIKVLHHNDLDGRGSAYLLYRAYPQLSADGCIEMTYGSKVPFDKITENTIVYIVDYSIEPNEMETLLDIANDVIWIDHHETALDKYEDFEYDIKGKRSMEECGCLLTLKYLQENNLLDIEGIPQFVEFINDWDMWNHDLEETINFRYGMYIQDTSPTKEIWTIAELKIEDIIRNGRLINEYRNQWNREYVEDFGFELNFEGYKTIALNLRKSSSLVFDSVDGDYEIKMLFAFNGDDFKVSIYTDKDYIHVGKLAEKYGGGGHPGAGGFYIDDIRKLKEE